MAGYGCLAPAGLLRRECLSFELANHGFRRRYTGRKRYRKMVVALSTGKRTQNSALLFSLHNPEGFASSSSRSRMEDAVEIVRSICKRREGRVDGKIFEFLQRNLLLSEQSLVVLYKEQEFIVSQIQLYSRAESVVMLVELVEMNIVMRTLEILKRFSNMFRWMEEIVERLKNLRLGMFLKHWEAFPSSRLHLANEAASIFVLKLQHHLDKYVKWRRKRLTLGAEASKSPSPETPDEDKHHSVKCRVEIVSWRERYVSASVCVDASVDRVWEVLTEYEKLAEFIPNLVYSAKIPSPHQGRIWLLQRGMHAAMHWHIEATAILELEELPYSVEGKSLRFCMVDGDFKMFSGRWLLKPASSPGRTIVYYEANVIPKLLLPGIFVERIIKSDLPGNLRAIAKRAENLLPDASMTKFPTDESALAAPMQSIVLKLQTPKGQVRSFVKPDDKIYVEKWDKKDPATKAKRLCKSEGHCAVDAVHLRRLNEDNGEFWRAVAAVTIAASPEDVWSVLTAYEDLTEFVPNLSSSRILSRSGNRVRILQEGCKCLLYMVLHARVVLNLHESHPTQIAFEQEEGDFEVFKGKWTLESLGNKHTLLKYTVDIKMQKDSLLLPEEIVEEVVYEDLPENLCAIRARVELGESCYIDHVGEASPAYNSTSDKPRLQAETSSGDAELLLKTPKRKKVPGLQRDIKVLERELRNFISQRGKPRVMPMREELRQQGRVDLEKSIARFGGFAAIAARLNFHLAYKDRKPRGYWDDIENLRREISLFQNEHRKDTQCMPSRPSLEKAGRYDIARALEKWGGVYEVANILGLQVKTHKGLKQQHQQEQPPDTGVSSTDDAETRDKNNVEQQASVVAPFKTSLPVVSSVKWMNLDKGS